MSEPVEKNTPTEKEQKDVARQIASELGETATKPRRQIERIVEKAGIDFAQRLLKETDEIEANGGMMIDSGDRRRTKGGVFFYLARRDLPVEIRDEIFHTWRVMRRQQEEREAQYDSFEWEERVPLIESLIDPQQEQGGVTEVRVNLTGRPGEIERRQNLVITTMTFQASEGLTLPSGVPDFPNAALSYVIYISSKQWEKVEKAIQNPHDELIVEGLCALDPETTSLAVYTTFVTTKKLMRKERKQAKREQQATATNGKKEKSGKLKPGDGDAPRKKRPSREIPTAEDLAQPQIELNLPDSVPGDVADKLTELHTAAATYRQKISRLEENSGGQQFMLNMTRKLLKNTEKQIEEIEKEHNINE